MGSFHPGALAGDELAGAQHGDPDAGIRTPEAAELLAATGFLRNAPDGTGDEVPDQNLARNQVVAETLKIVSSSLLGLTVGCAPMPRSSLRSDLAGRLLPAARGLRAGVRTGSNGARRGARFVLALHARATRPARLQSSARPEWIWRRTH